MNRMKTKWVQTRKARPCPACGKHGWCSISEDGALAMCRQGAESAHPVREKDGNTAYLHSVEGLGQPVKSVSGGKAPAPRLTATDLKNLAKQHKTALAPRRLAATAKLLGLDESALLQYGAGYDAQRAAISFPMYDGDQKLVGFRLRAEGGKKLCVPGSANGLFLPVGFDVAEPSDPWPDVDRFTPMLLLTPEGPTDCAAAWQAGFTAIGRPSCTGGANLIARLLERCRAAGAPRDVVVVADADETKWHDRENVPFWPGWEGSLDLAAGILRPAASVRVIKPPPGAKDLRALVKMIDPAGPANGLGAAIVCAIEAAPMVDAAWVAFNRQLLVEVKSVCRALLVGKGKDAGARKDAEAFARDLARTRRAEAWLKSRGTNQQRRTA